MVRLVPATKYKHKEAYCLMLYESKDGKVKETIWNSRDGVTPFMIQSKDGVMLQHKDWAHDKITPNHVLKSGDRYFADMEKDRAKFLAKRWCDRFYKKSPVKKMYSREEYEFILTKEYYGDGHNPTILEAGKDPITYIPKWMDV